MPPARRPDLSRALRLEQELPKRRRSWECPSRRYGCASCSGFEDPRAQDARFAAASRVSARTRRALAAARVASIRMPRAVPLMKIRQAYRGGSGRPLSWPRGGVQERGVESPESKRDGAQGTKTEACKKEGEEERSGSSAMGWTDQAEPRGTCTPRNKANQIGNDLIHELQSTLSVNCVYIYIYIRPW